MFPVVNRPKYVGGGLFDYLALIMVQVTTDEAPSLNGYDPAAPVIAEFDATFSVPYFAKVGNNAAEFMHPEEIIATNYGMISDKETNVKSPEIMKKIGEAMLIPEADRRSMKKEEEKRGAALLIIIVVVLIVVLIGVAVGVFFHCKSKKAAEPQDAG